MKPFLMPLAIGLVILCAAALAAAAAATGRIGPSSDGYSEDLGQAFALTAPRASLDATACYDACAAIWGPEREARIASQ